jgi:hypothetical protein
MEGDTAFKEEVKQMIDSVLPMIEDKTGIFSNREEP